MNSNPYGFDRKARYVAAIKAAAYPLCPTCVGFGDMVSDCVECIALAVMVVAEREKDELRAADRALYERYLDTKRRAEAAEAEVERLTGELEVQSEARISATRHASHAPGVWLADCPLCASLAFGHDGEATSLRACGCPTFGSWVMCCTQERDRSARENYEHSTKRAMLGLEWDELTEEQQSGWITRATSKMVESDLRRPKRTPDVKRVPR